MKIQLQEKTPSDVDAVISTQNREESPGQDSGAKDGQGTNVKERNKNSLPALAALLGCACD